MAAQAVATAGVENDSNVTKQFIPNRGKPVLSFFSLYTDCVFIVVGFVQSVGTKV